MRQTQIEHFMHTRSASRSVVSLLKSSRIFEFLVGGILFAKHSTLWNGLPGVPGRSY